MKDEFYENTYYLKLMFYTITINIYIKIYTGWVRRKMPKWNQIAVLRIFTLCEVTSVGNLVGYPDIKFLRYPIPGIMGRLKTARIDFFCLHNLRWRVFGSRRPGPEKSGSWNRISCSENRCLEPDILFRESDPKTWYPLSKIGSWKRITWSENRALKEESWRFLESDILSQETVLGTNSRYFGYPGFRFHFLLVLDSPSSNQVPIIYSTVIS